MSFAFLKTKTSVVLGTWLLAHLNLNRLYRFDDLSARTHLNQLLVKFEILRSLTFKPSSCAPKPSGIEACTGSFFGCD